MVVGTYAVGLAARGTGHCAPTLNPKDFERFGRWVTLVELPEAAVS